MTLKLSEIFIPLPEKYIYSEVDLCDLELRPAFIKKMDYLFKLTYFENKGVEGNLCFVENKEVRPEYRTTFGKADVVEYVFAQLSGEVVNITLDEVRFGEVFFF